MFWVNGQPASTISLSDRSFQYGDGCFTTILTKQGTLIRWDLHLERMQACLQRLGITQPDWQQVSEWANLAALDEPYAGLKLHISRGSGGRGYSPKGINTPTVTVSHFSYPQHYFNWQKEGIQLGVCKLKLGLMPLLAGHKHNNRLEQVLLKQELEQSGLQDGVVMDINNHVIETTMANLFWIKQGVLYTPSLNSCGVAGIIRKTVLSHAKRLNIATVVDEFYFEHLQSAQEVFMTNSILGVAPVTRINNFHFDIGALTRRIQESLIS
ncbi:aminodeoxychorismate lyase [Vibrio sp. MA40-2]|uniref:aminodeoxychorismate lyase n=1 Tax=Vibrio sp. MA40-2 TaxID=3391828 RepID=UPI0039A60463